VELVGRLMRIVMPVRVCTGSCWHALLEDLETCFVCFEKNLIDFLIRQARALEIRRDSLNVVSDLVPLVTLIRYD
jgi:hypothetical protein